MRYIVVRSVLITTLAVALNAQIVGCPAIHVAGPSGFTYPGKPMVFVAKIAGVSAPDALGYEWTVTSPAKIIAGQKTASLDVDTVEASNMNVTATVKITGLPPGCSNTASETAAVSAQVIVDYFTEYGKVTWDEERAQLDPVQIRMQNEPESKAFFHIYYPASQSIQEVKKHVARMVTHFRSRDKRFDITRLTFGLERSTETRTVWVMMPKNVKEPECKGCEIVHARDVYP